MLTLSTPQRKKHKNLKHANTTQNLQIGKSDMQKKKRACVKIGPRSTAPLAHPGLSLSYLALGLQFFQQNDSSGGTDK